jgi:hypothetical protein
LLDPSLGLFRVLVELQAEPKLTAASVAAKTNAAVTSLETFISGVV